MKRLAPIAAALLSLLLYFVVFAQGTPGTIRTDGNLRSGPGSGYSNVGVAKKGQSVIVVAQNPSGDWYQLEGGAWIFASLVIINADTIAATPAPTPTPAVLSTIAVSISLQSRVFALETVQADLITRISELERAAVKPITPVAIATLTQSEGELYIVQVNDKMLAIAEHFGVTVEQIMVANGLTDAEFLFSGQRLMIPFSNTLPITLAATSTPVPIVPTALPIPTVIAPTLTRMPPPTPRPTPIANPNELNYEIIRVDSKVTESNQMWERNAWIVTIKNNGPQTLLFNLTFEFLDADGFILDQDVQYGLLLEPFATTDYSGFKLILIDQSMNVTSINAKALVTDYE